MIPKPSLIDTAHIMVPRAERRAQHTRLHLLTATLFLAALLFTVLSVLAWWAIFREEPAWPLVLILQYVYLGVVTAYVFFASQGEFFAVLMKILLRLLFTIWVPIFVLFALLTELEKSTLVYTLVFIVGYLEAFLELHMRIYDMSNSDHFPMTGALSRRPVPVTMAVMAVVHATTGLLFKEVLTRIVGK